MNAFERLQVVSAIAAVYGASVWKINKELFDWKNVFERRFACALGGVAVTLLIVIVGFVLTQTIYWVVTGQTY